jgi:hypothetical protein
MTYTTKLTRIGDGRGILVPEEVLAKLGVADESPLYLTPTTGGFAIAAEEPSVDDDDVLLDQIMREREAVFRKLAE